MTILGLSGVNKQETTNNKPVTLLQRKHATPEKPLHFIGNPKPTKEEQQAIQEGEKALEKLNLKIASNGMSYKEATNIIYKIEKDFFKKTSRLMTIVPPKFNPEKLKEPDKSNYKNAKKACDEIQAKYPELVEKVQKGKRASILNFFS